ncbi:MULTISPECIES: hypothetical protein [unclassified Nocardiopsis]|uniref:hypothetical protein n=1 Tax=unclassified Nocardiopsis TaxID=2649073 RepID=UPI00066ECAFB|nr:MULTISPECIES: hypothetical protein [unclassified Nocardiopsis]MBQ1082347.1 hypothetical protein [Nocardiopsis sp. B62]
MGETEVGAGTRGRVVQRARELRAPWGRRSRERGWNPAEDWWTPSVDAVCEAHTTGSDLTEPCSRLGEARARSGVGIGRALADLDAFGEVVGWDRLPLDLVRALADGWVEGGRGRDTCQDPLTGLANEAYLRTRIRELYRSAEETVPAAFDHRLVVLALDPTLDPWRRAARLIVLGHELNRFFTRGESVCLVSRARIAVVAREVPVLGTEIEELRSGIGWEHGAAVWSVPLPATHREAAALIDGLGRPVRDE